MARKATTVDTHHLELVDGEMRLDSPEALKEALQSARDIIKGLERDVRAWARRYAELERDKDAEARAHEAWPILLALFDYWRAETGHKKAKWSAQRFWAALPYLETWGVGNMAAAIAGLGYDAYQKPVKNGKMERYDDWEKNLCKDDGTIERLMKRRPAGWAVPAELEPFVGQLPGTPDDKAREAA